MCCTHVHRRLVTMERGMHVHCAHTVSLSACSVSMGFLVEESTAVVWRGLMVCVTCEVHGDTLVGMYARSSCKFLLQVWL